LLNIIYYPLPLKIPIPLPPKGTEDGYAFGLNFNWLFFDGGAATLRAKQAATGMAIAEQAVFGNSE
jgi:hypothetical protein